MGCGKKKDGSEERRRRILGEFKIAAVGGRVERRPALEVAHVDVRATIQQPAHLVHVVVDARLHCIRALFILYILRIQRFWFTDYL